MATAFEVLRRRGPDPLVAAALSAVWPGLGHFKHNTRRALLLINSTLAAAVIGLAYTATRSVTTLLTWSVTRSSLQILMAAALGVLVFRAAVTVDAYRNAALRYRPRRRNVAGRFGTFVTVVVLAVIIAAPHVIAIRFAAAQLILLSSVFDATRTETAIPTPVSTTTVRTTLAPAAPGEMPRSSVPVPQTTAAPSTAPSTTTTHPTWDGADRLTIVLLGSDGGFDRTGVRTDTIIVLSIEVATGDAAAFNVPRNWKNLTFPEGTPASERWPEGYPEIANEVYGLGLRAPEAFPGIDDTAGHAIKSALAQLTGLAIQYYVLLDMQGFVGMIDLFGGIDVYVTETINDRIKPIVPDGPHIDIVVEPGKYHFDGLTALGYVRSRTKTSDYHRMTRQRCVVGALIDQMTPAEILANYLPLIGLISNHITTDIPLDRMDDLIVLGERLDTSRIVTVNFIPPEYPRGPAPIAQVREAVSRALQGSTNEANSLLAPSCGAPG